MRWITSLPSTRSGSINRWARISAATLLLAFVPVTRGQWQSGTPAGRPTPFAGFDDANSGPSNANGSTDGVGSPAEQGQISSLLGEIAGGSTAASGLNDLLLGPILRGNAVAP